MEKLIFNMNLDENPTLSQYCYLLNEYTGTQPNPAFDKLREVRNEAQQKLISALNPKQFELFDTYEDSEADVEAYQEQQVFLLGFKSAMRMAMESLK